MNDELQKKAEQLTEMALTDKELYARLTGAASAKELADICREQGIELSSKETGAAFELLQDYLYEGESRPLSEVELERVAAGGKVDSGIRRLDRYN